MTRIKIHIFNVKLPFYPPCEVKCGLQNMVSTCTLFHDLFYSAQSPLVLRAFSEADWAGDPTDRRSTTSYYFFLGSSLISWQSKKQTLVARSSIEVEYRALTDTTSKFLWIL